MGWEDDHLHEFRAYGERFRPPPPDGVVSPFGPPVKDERQVRLRDVLTRPQAVLVYEYDFGDAWEHDVVVEQIIPVREGAQYPRCLAGRRAGPPEDSGGAYGYAALLRACSDPEDPDHEGAAERLGADYDPELFDLKEANGQLAQWGGSRFAR
jgi:hypothetical protein